MPRFSCNFYSEAIKQIRFQMLKFEPQFILFIFIILSLSLFPFSFFLQQIQKNCRDFRSAWREEDVSSRCLRSRRRRVDALGSPPWPSRNLVNEVRCFEAERPWRRQAVVAVVARRSFYSRGCPTGPLRVCWTTQGYERPWRTSSWIWRGWRWMLVSSSTGLFR